LLFGQLRAFSEVLHSACPRIRKSQANWRLKAGPQVKTMDEINPVHDPRVLLDRFEYMFNDPHARFDFYRGWMPMTVQVCEAIDAVLGNDKRDFRWAQIKEKFGEARFYYYVQSSSAHDVEIITTKTPVGATVRVAANPADPVAREIANIVAKAQDESRSTCQVCVGAG